MKKIFNKIAGKKKYQSLFEKLYRLSLKGMNVGSGGSHINSGELFAMKYIAQKISNSDNLVVFDVGANVGNYTLMISDVFKNNTQIFSFEPSVNTFNLLIDNTKKINNIKQFNFGFGAKTETLTLYSNDNTGLSSVYERNLEHFNMKLGKKEEIRIHTIDEFCIQNKINHIHFLKMDVEGHELKILEGAKQMINSNCIDYIQFEFGGCNIDSRTFFQDFYYLLKDKYNIYRILKDGLFKISSYQEVYELFVTTNFLAEKK